MTGQSWPIIFYVSRPHARVLSCARSLGGGLFQVDCRCYHTAGDWGVHRNLQWENQFPDIDLPSDYHHCYYEVSHKCGFSLHCFRFMSLDRAVSACNTVAQVMDGVPLARDVLKRWSDPRANAMREVLHAIAEGVAWRSKQNTLDGFHKDFIILARGGLEFP